MTIPVDESIEELIQGKLQIVQAKKGYRYSIDPFLLISFLTVRAGDRVIDLGSGSGVVPLLLSHKFGLKKIVGLELQDDFVERSRRSVALNNLQDLIEIVSGDVRKLPECLQVESFDIVVTNPPYRVPGTGRHAPNDERSMARHELSGGLVDFLAAAKFLLKNKGGRFFIVYLAERLAELLDEMRSAKLEPKRMRMVHSRVGGSARLVLVEGVKNGNPGLMVEAPLYVYSGEGREYSEEVVAMYEELGVSNQ